MRGRASADPAVSHATLECFLHAGRADVKSGYVIRFRGPHIKLPSSSAYAQARPLIVAVQSTEVTEVLLHPICYEHVPVLASFAITIVDAHIASASIPVGVNLIASPGRSAQWKMRVKSGRKRMSLSATITDSTFSRESAHGRLSDRRT